MEYLNYIASVIKGSTSSIASVIKGSTSIIASVIKGSTSIIASVIRGYNAYQMKGTEVLTLSAHNLEKMMTTPYSQHSYQ